MTHFIINIIIISFELHYTLIYSMINIGKAVPTQVWTGPVGSRRLKSTDFRTEDT